MTDDIVTRLRNHVRGDYEKTAEYLLGLAADEIERLREEVARLGSFLYPVGVSIYAKEGKDFDAEKISEIVKKAVRHDES